MIGAADIRFCESCRRGTPHSRKGDCKTCSARVRKAGRLARRSVVGSPLASYSELLKVADALWSIWVRAYWPGCEMCGGPLDPDRLQCAHGFSRVEKTLRFDPDNTYALDASCHRRHTPPRQDWWDWMRMRLAARVSFSEDAATIGAERYARLEMASRARGGKLSSYSLQAVIVEAQARIAALPEGDRKEWAKVKAERALSKLASFGSRCA